MAPNRLLVKNGYLAAYHSGHLKYWFNRTRIEAGLSHHPIIPTGCPVITEQR